MILGQEGRKKNAREGFEGKRKDSKNIGGALELSGVKPLGRGFEVPELSDQACGNGGERGCSQTVGLPKGSLEGGENGLRGGGGVWQE